MRGDLKGIAQGAGGGVLAGAAVLATYIVATANARGANGGDWLAFAGVFFGVAFTIAGTLSVDWFRKARADKAVAIALQKALGDWIKTINAYPQNRNAAALKDLDQQLAYITSLAPEVSRDATLLNLALHAFGFHVPRMIETLQRQLVSMTPVAPADEQRVLDDLRGYAANVQSVLPRG